MQKGKPIIRTVKLDFGLLSLSPWTKITNVCTSHSNVQALMAKFFSGFQVSCNRKVERTWCQIGFLQFEVCGFCAQHLCILAIWGQKRASEEIFCGNLYLSTPKMALLAHEEKWSRRSPWRCVALARDVNVSLGNCATFPVGPRPFEDSEEKW